MHAQLMCAPPPPHPAPPPHPPPPRRDRRRKQAKLRSERMHMLQQVLRSSSNGTMGSSGGRGGEGVLDDTAVYQRIITTGVCWSGVVWRCVGMYKCIYKTCIAHHHQHTVIHAYIFILYTHTPTMHTQNHPYALMYTRKHTRTPTIHTPKTYTQENHTHTHTHSRPNTAQVKKGGGNVGAVAFVVTDLEHSTAMSNADGAAFKEVQILHDNVCCVVCGVFCVV